MYQSNSQINRQISRQSNNQINNQINSQSYGHSNQGNRQVVQIDTMPVAMCYVPWQSFDQVYDLDKGFMCGTIFPELNKPFMGKGGYR